VHDSSNGVDFQVSIGKTGNLRCHDETEKHGSLDMIVCKIRGMLPGVFKGFGDKWGVGNGNTRKDASWEWCCFSHDEAKEGSEQPGCWMQRKDFQTAGKLELEMSDREVRPTDSEPTQTKTDNT